MTLASLKSYSRAYRYYNHVRNCHRVAMETLSKNYTKKQLVVTISHSFKELKNFSFMNSTGLFIYFRFLSHEGPTLEKYRKYTSIFYISIFISSAELWNTFWSCLKLCNSLAVVKSSHNKMYFLIKYNCTYKIYLHPLWLHLIWNSVVFYLSQLVLE